MDFHRPGWLARYIDFRSAHPFPNILPSSDVKMLDESVLHHRSDEAIYSFLQPTGLLYGFPIGLPFPRATYPDLKDQAQKEKVHLIFLDSLFACLVADRHYLLENLTEEQEHFPPALAAASVYFINRGRKGKGNSVLNSIMGLSKRGSKPHANFEKDILVLLDHSNEFLKLSGFYYNSFLFLDIYHCMIWQRKTLMEPDRGVEILRQLGELQSELRQLLIRLMIAAASASGKVVSMERRLIEWFLKSSRLPRAQQSSLRADMKKGLKLDEIEIPEQPWLVRRFMLESVMMTMLIDYDLSLQEKGFLNEVVEKLGLWEEELNQSLLALEVFILNHREQLEVLQEKPFFLNVGVNIKHQATALLKTNLNKIVQEIHETHELYNLLLKSTHKNLTPEEKEKVKRQLLDILKTIPALAIFALPGGAVILPILIKLLPFNLLPSSFED